GLRTLSYTTLFRSHAEEDEQDADHELQGREGDPLQCRADRQSEHREERCAGAGADDGRTPSTGRPHGEHDRERLHELYERREEGGEDDGANVRPAHRTY